MAKQLGRQSEGQAGVGRTERETGERRQSRSVRSVTAQPYPASRLISIVSTSPQLTHTLK